MTSMHCLFSAIDPSLGRFDCISLPDQALMEMLIEGLEDPQKQRFLDDDGNFREISDWTELQCANDSVSEIHFAYQKFTKTQFPFEHTPKLVSSYMIISCNLYGTLETGVLPLGLTRLNLYCNDLYGSVNFKLFPRKLQYINISFNSFSGGCSLSDLPETLTQFHAFENKFRGEISLNHLPTVMEHLWLHGNALTGPLHIKSLPESMEVINLSSNLLSGDFVLLTANARSISIAYNQMSSRAVLFAGKGEMLFEIWHDGITQVVDPEGNHHEWEENIVRNYYVANMF